MRTLIRLSGIVAFGIAVGLGLSAVLTQPVAAQDGAQMMAIIAPPTGAVEVVWTPDPSAASYRIYATLQSQPLNFSVQQTVNQPIGELSSSAFLANLAPGAPYFIQVRMVDATGAESPAAASILGGPGYGPPVSPYYGY